MLRAASVLDTHGKEVAEHVASFEARQISAIRQLVARENIECDFEETRVVDVCLYPQGQHRMKAAIDKITRAGISTAKPVKYTSGAKAEEISGVRGAMSCHTYNAARLSPYRLVTRLLEQAVTSGVNLQTFTPATKVEAKGSDPSDQLWLVTTPRGCITARTVIYATNGYTAALVPEVREKIVPVRGMVARLAGPVVQRMKDSYMMRFSDYEYDYMIPRPDGSIVLGGGRRDYFETLNEWFNVSDDSKLMKGARGYFDGYMQRHFHAWEDSEFFTEEIWTGSKYEFRIFGLSSSPNNPSVVMGYSNDDFPYVGAVPEKTGQYMCAGFTGHGMPQIFLAAKALASMVLTGDSRHVDLPVPYRISQERWLERKPHAALKMWQKTFDMGGAHARL